jgi:hypothetical protein
MLFTAADTVNGESHTGIKTETNGMPARTPKTATKYTDEPVRDTTLYRFGRRRRIR